MPLTSLMKQQESYLIAKGFNVCFVDTHEKVSAIMDNTYTHIFTSPETLVEHVVPKLQSASAEIRSAFSHIFVDESHCVPKWLVFLTSDFLITNYNIYTCINMYVNM